MAQSVTTKPKAGDAVEQDQGQGKLVQKVDYNIKIGNCFHTLAFVAKYRDSYSPLYFCTLFLQWVTDLFFR